MSKLEDLLDDALADFEDDVPVIAVKQDTKEDVAEENETPIPDFEQFCKSSQDDEEKYIDDLTTEFEKAFQDILQSTPNLNHAQLNLDLDEERPTSSSSVDENIARTVEGMMRDAASTGPASEGQGSDGMVPVLESLLGKLLSKEILHEPLQELYNFYPEWLENNADHPKIDVYKKQCQIVKDICDIFNGPNYQTESTKVYTLLNDMQETGPPPDDIVNKMSQEIPGAMRSGPPPNPDQCSLM